MNQENSVNLEHYTHFVCPLTKLIFAEPVVAADGHIYEEMAIKEWLKENDTSPTTGENMNPRLVKVHPFKALVDKFMEEHPELYEQKFLVKKPYYLFKNEFVNELQNKNFENLKDYTNIIINDYLEIEEHNDDSSDSYESSSIFSDDSVDYFTIITYLAKHCTNYDAIKHVLDNSLDYDMEDEDGYRPIHMVSKYSNPEIIKHLIEKGIDIESCDANGMRPMHYVCQYQNFNDDLVKYMIEKNVDLYAVDQNGYQPLHYLVKCLYNTQSLQHFINKGIDMEVETLSGWRSLHIACRYASDVSYIKFMVDLNVQLDAVLQDEDELEGKTCDNLINENTFLEKKEKQEAVYYYLDKLLHRPDIKEDYLNQNINKNDLNQDVSASQVFESGNDNLIDLDNNQNKLYNSIV